MNNIIFFDIDGTIIDHFKKEIPKSTIDALIKLQKNNKLVIATGKGPTFIETFLPKEIIIDTYIALNGNYVVYNNEIISKHYLPKKDVKDFVDYCLALNIDFVLSDQFGTKTLIKNSNAITNYYNNFSLPYPEIINSIVDYGSYFQMSVMLDETQLKSEKEMRAIFKQFIFVRMSKYGLNVLFNNGLKEKGIKILLDYTKWDKNKTIAFGDGLNDIGMFQLVNTSVAMGNAYQELKDVATITTDHISENGLYNACKRLNLF